MKHLLLTALIISGFQANAFAYELSLSQERIDEANAERHARLDADQRHLDEKGIKESLIDKAYELDKIEILMGDEIAEKWFFIKKYGNKDCFETMPFELQKKYFKTELRKKIWKGVCRKVQARGDTF